MGVECMRKRVLNVRRPEVMERVRAEVDRMSSPLVSFIREQGDELHLENVHIRLASSFGFCDGVRRAIEIAYATCFLYPERRIWLIGDIIHNPEVNARLEAMGLLHLPWRYDAREYGELRSGDVVIIPAFGVSVAMRRGLEALGVDLVDSTCGNVVKVWMQVRRYARLGITSIIHGKASHEESVATASQSLGDEGKGRFIVIRDDADARCLAEYIVGRGDREIFMSRFRGCTSAVFDPDVDFDEIGMANQTTMLKGETERIQRILRRAVVERDGDDARFHAFNTICGATQDRQNALFALLEHPLDAVFIVGGYNSSNTTHLAQIASDRAPTFFVKSADCLLSLSRVRCFDWRKKEESVVPLPGIASDCGRCWRIGITAGASCPANVIEDVVRRLALLRGCSLPL